MFCFFFKLFTHCFVFIYFVARGGFGIPESIKHFLDNPVPAPAQPRQLAQPSQRRRHTNPSRAYCKISEFIWLYKDDIENLRGWIGHTNDPWGNDWRDLCISSTCIDKARAILQPGSTDPELVLELQLPTEKRAESLTNILNHLVLISTILRSFKNHRNVREVLSSLQPTNSMASFTLCTVNPCHPVIRPSCTIMSMIQHAHNLPTATHCIKSNCCINLPAAEVGYIGGKSMLK